MTATIKPIETNFTGWDQLIELSSHKPVVLVSDIPEPEGVVRIFPGAEGGVVDWFDFCPGTLINLGFLAREARQPARMTVQQRLSSVPRSKISPVRARRAAVTVTRGSLASDRLTMALLNLVGTGQRPHCSDPDNLQLLAQRARTK
jgi:hypothetical protein